MSRRELKSSGGVLHSRLRSGLTCGLSPLGMDGGGEAGAETTRDSQASDVWELREKLQMAQKELEWVRADLTRRLERAELTAAEERAGIVDQLQQAQQMAETTKEDSEEQRCWTREAEQQLEEQGQEDADLHHRLREAENRIGAKVEAIGLRLKLDGLRGLEEIRKKFNLERKWHRHEHDQDAALIADLHARLEGRDHALDGGGELTVARESMGTLRSVNCESTVRGRKATIGEREKVLTASDRKVAFTPQLDNSGFPRINTPSTSRSQVSVPAGGLGCDSDSLMPTSSVASRGPTPTAGVANNTAGVGDTAGVAGLVFREPWRGAYSTAYSISSDPNSHGGCTD